MEKTDMYIHAFTSPDALKVAGRVKDEGQIRIALIPWKWIICLVACAAASDR